MNQKKNFFELVTELIGWVSIAISPLLIGSLLGLLIYISKTDRTGLILAILVAGSGLITGIVWASRIWKKGGTIQFLSRLISSEQMQEKEETDQSKS